MNMHLSLQDGDSARILGTDYTGVVISRTSLYAQFRYDANGRVRNVAAEKLEKI